ncbi:MAG: response regulator [Spirochaetota bacterium]
MRVLIAEDEQGFGIVYKRLMGKWGFDFDLVNNGRDAVSRAVENEGKYDICLMDIDMPVMDGCEAAKLIRLKTKYLPIIAVTGDARLKNKYSEFGMDAYIMKPFSFNELQEKIIELSIKSEKITYIDNELHIEKEMPMDKQHAEELRELAKKDLRKVKFFDDPGAAVVVHKNVVNKISYDLSIKKQSLTVFLNRDTEKPTRCILYREIPHLMPQEFLTEDEYDKSIKTEDQDLQEYNKLILKPEEK